VFVATRLDERNDEGADRYALKVPEYSATVARSLSEADFMKMFRQEAAALLTLPTHPNLARFVLFDDASKPKPILVMELVEGTPFDRLVEARGLETARVLEILDGVLCGLTAMHDVGVGHLDVKPSNVVLRKAGEPVLVDFGLAGRRIRPGCATGPYGAPEVWGALDGQEEPPPAKADVYAFACVAFEALTGRLLFDAPSEMAQIAMHLSHDGFPEPLKALATRAKKGSASSELAELLSKALRHDPRERPTAAIVRKSLARLAPALSKAPWPIDAV
jgi:serine/threonine protein kinase